MHLAVIASRVDSHPTNISKCSRIAARICYFETHILLALDLHFGVCQIGCSVGHVEILDIVANGAFALVCKSVAHCFYETQTRFDLRRGKGEGMKQTNAKNTGA